MNILMESILKEKELHEKKRKKFGTAAASVSMRPLESTIPKKRIVSKLLKRKSAETTNCLNPKKKSKSEERCTKNVNVPDDFGVLKMEKLDDHDVPEDILKTEINQNNKYLSAINQMVQDSTTDRFRYTQAYTALLQLEEAAEVLSMRKYNQSFIQLSYVDTGRKFRIKTDVS